MPIRTVHKIKNGWTTVSDQPDEGSYRYTSKAKALAHIAKLERFDAETIQYRAEERDRRLKLAAEYIQARAERPKVVQYSFGF